jgi:putative nucleotidyltransferase with HDIG domain
MHTASLAKTIMKEAGAPTSTVDQTFIAGLLHDIGKVILASELGEDYQQVVHKVRQTARPFDEVEMDVIGATHAEVGAFLLGLWGLPGEVMEAVNYHHRPLESAMGEFGVLAAVHVANVFARQSDSDSLDAQDVCMPYIERLGLIERLEHWRRVCFPDQAGREVA